MCEAAGWLLGDHNQIPGLAVVHGVREVCVCVSFFSWLRPNFGKSEAISYVNPSKFRPGGQQQLL
jgi:hypothetical protein